LERKINFAEKINSNSFSQKTVGLISKITAKTFKNFKKWQPA
jgi:hypothetical protein